MKYIVIVALLFIVTFFVTQEISAQTVTATPTPTVSAVSPTSMPAVTSAPKVPGAPATGRGGA